MADGDCNHEIKRHLPVGRKAMTNLDSILKNRDTTLSAKVRLVKAMVYPVVMYGCESWTIKKTERGRIDAFELWCWRRLWRVPWTARRSNQSILREISPGCLLEGLKVKLKLQYFGHLMWRADSLENTLMLGNIEGRKRGQQRMRWLDGITELTHWKRLWCWETLKAGKEENRGWDGWMASLTQWIWVWVNSRSWWWTGGLVCSSSWGLKESDTTERLNWTELIVLGILNTQDYINEWMSIHRRIHCSFIEVPLQFTLSWTSCLVHICKILTNQNIGRETETLYGS